MPVPIRDDGSRGPTRRLIVLVHGFNSSAETWAPLKRLLAEDPQITASFDIDSFDYKTGLGRVPVIQRLPTVEESGKELAAFLDRDLRRADGQDRFIDTTLVGHSMGGLVIQSCLKHLLNKGRGRDLNRIRQVILFATPNFGSSVVSGFRRAVSQVFSNPQERALRMFSDESRVIHEGIRDQIIFAKRRLDAEYPLPFHCFWGESDAVVVPVSAQGHFPSGAPLPGDHFGVHSPPNADDPRYTAFVNSLLHPYGHPNVWEVERFLFAVKVWPLAPGTEIAAQHGDKRRTVTCDNAAKVIRQATFGNNNLCRDPYVLKYGTRNGGWVVPAISQPHCTPADKLRLYDDNGFDAYYEVEPKAGSTSTLSATVYKGFDAGHRDFHMHLGKSTYFRRLCMELDLTEYVRLGWRITPPRLYFHPTDPGDHVLCAQRDMLPPDPAHAVDPAGIWKWELEFVKEGVVDFVFNVEPPLAAGEATPVISLRPNEHTVLGYGSLLSIASLERTLGRTYAGPFYRCEVAGWRRSWDVAMPNQTFAYRDKEHAKWETPEKIFYLNIQPRADSRMNGIIFVVNTEELEKFDQREWIYDRVAVTENLRGVRVDGGTAWAYRGKPEYVSAHPASPRMGAVRRTYLDILAAGHRDLGAEFAAAYTASTDAVPEALVVDDVRKSELPDP